jgi:hypothetical protein
MHRLMTSAVAVALAVLLLPALAADGTPKDAKEALQVFNDYIGTWKGSGGPDKLKLSPSDPIWNETIEWGWKFKGKDCWIALDFKGSKRYKSGDLRWLPDKKQYELTLVDLKDQKLVFLGQVEEPYFTAERVDPVTKEIQQLKMSVFADGARLTYRYAYKAPGKTLFTKDIAVSATKEGLSLGSAQKKNECVVTGGLGTMAVSYKGMTYYVCCSGCRDAFNEDPEKIIAEYLAKKKAGK